MRYRSSGQSRKHTLGAFPTIDLKTARTLASKSLRAAAEGRDPGREKALQRSTVPNSVDAVARQFIDLHCKRVNKRRTIESTQTLLDLHVLPRWRKRLIKDITRRDVLDLLDGIVTSGRPVAANRVLSAISKLFAWCMDRDIIASSPCAGVKPPTLEQSRDRVLDDAELGKVWRAADQLGGPYGALVKLLMLTGARRNEIASMEWNEINLEARLWTLPAARSKNGQPHHLPLSEPVIAVLQTLPRISDRFVLSTDSRTAAGNFSQNRRKLDALLPAEMPAWRLHDLRRSAASGMARLGVNLPVIEKVLNHVSGSFGGIVGVYQRHDFADEKRRALERWGAHVAGLVSGRRSRNVVTLSA